MKNQNDGHLLDEQITWAVVDAEELSGEHRRHLVECRLCQGKVDQFMAELQVFGEKTKLSVPPLTKTMRMPHAEPSAAKYRSNWIPFIAGAAMAGLVLFFYFLGMDAMSPQLATVQGPDDPFDDEYLMQEISEMVEYPLPAELYEITGDAADFEDDFFQFVVPDFQEDQQS
jgi:hypothetical protein